MSLLCPQKKEKTKPTNQKTLTPKLVWVMLLFKKAFGYLAEAWT